VKNRELRQTETSRIPKDWSLVKLSDEKVCQIVMGQSPPSSTYNKTGEGLPFLQGNMEFGEIYPSPSIYCSKPIKIAEENDVLISVRAPVGEVNISPSRVCIGRGLAAIRCKLDKTNDLFLFYYLKHTGKKLENISAGSTFKAIRKNDLDQLEIFMPLLPEQKKIAEILSTVDQAIEKVYEAIEKIQKLKKGLMQELLTKGIGHKEFKETEIGRIPKEWEIVKILELGKIITGGTPSTSDKTYWNGSIPFITPADIKENKYVYQTERYITLEGASKVGFLLPANTVLAVCIGSTIGKTGVTSEEAVINQQINAVICDEKVDKDYVYYAITFKTNLLKTFSGTAAVPIIKKSLFEQIKLPFPSLPEQQKIAEILSTVDKRLESLRNRKEKLERIKKGLMGDLLTGRKRVRLA
jgi:type I restriction enzyme S subunit